VLKSCQRFTLHQCRPAIARPPYSISRLCAETTVAVPDAQALEIEPAPTLVHLEFFFFSPFVIFEPLAALCVMVDSRVGLGA
jgi:hypothetical protein